MKEGGVQKMAGVGQPRAVLPPAGTIQCRDKVTSLQRYEVKF